MAMDWHLYLSVGVFLTVIAVIAFDLLPMVVASLLGTAILYLSGIVGLTGHSAARVAADPVLSLLIGGMVITRALVPTGVFAWLSEKTISLCRGKGWRLLVGIVLLTTCVSSLLPNEVTVVLLAPVFIAAARRFNLDIIPLMLLAVFVANSAGLFTLVGDPATYIAGSSIRMTFPGYLQTMSAGGLCAVLTIVALLPVVFRDIWRKELGVPPQETGEVSSAAAIARPVVLAVLLAIMGLMVLFFVIGDTLPTPMAPQLSCLAFATLALTVVHLSRLDSVSNIIKDIDWETIIFLASNFILVQGLESTGAISLLGTTMAKTLGSNILVTALTLLASIGLVSGVVPNVELMATMAPLMKSYVVSAGLVSQELLAHGAAVLPVHVLVIFYAMFLGVTLGGNLTLLGAAANIVACGICARAGSRVTFARFLRYGIPVTICQLCVSALFIFVKLRLR